MNESNYWFDYINSWDDLACYNIARFGFDYLEKNNKIDSTIKKQI